MTLGQQLARAQSYDSSVCVCTEFWAGLHQTLQGGGSESERASMRALLGDQSLNTATHAGSFEAKRQLTAVILFSLVFGFSLVLHGVLPHYMHYCRTHVNTALYE